MNIGFTEVAFDAGLDPDIATLSGDNTAGECRGAKEALTAGWLPDHANVTQRHLGTAV